LCEELLEQLEPLCRGRAEIVVRDVDTRPEWAASYGLRIPVLVAGDEEVCHYTLDRQAVLALLAAAGA
jgi:hypothetical protein